MGVKNVAMIRSSSLPASSCDGKRKAPPAAKPKQPSAPVQASPKELPRSGRSIGFHAKVFGLVLLGAGCFAVGGFLLPGPRQQAKSAKSGNKEAVVNAGTIPGDPRGAGAFLKNIDPGPALRLPSEEGPYAVARTIDREVDKALVEAGIAPSSLASDAEFLRRAYLDVTGQVPTLEQATAFLDSTEPYKRSRLIDELLASPNYGRHFAAIWSDLLVKRDFDNNKSLKTEAFAGWLAEQFNENRSWDKIVTDLLTAEGKEAQVPQTFFFLANQENNKPAPNKLVGASANLFMGVQLQCAECHVHPFTKAWTPKDFWGLAAFFGGTRAEREQDPKGKPKIGTATITDQAAAPAGKNKDAVKAALAPVTIARPDPTNPKKTLEKIPAKYFEEDKPPLLDKGSYRADLAQWMISSKNRYFAPAAVNRAWAHFFARGLVNPIEEMNDDNQPSHPALLKNLAQAFVQSGHDQKHLIRAICNTKAYQRTSRPLPGNAGDDKLLSRMAVKVMSANVLLDALATVTAKPTKEEPAKGKGKKAVAAPTVRFFDAREYGDDPTEFSYGVPQLLRLMNSNLSNSSREVADRLLKASNGDGRKALEDIYLTALARRPTEAEVKKMSDFVGKQSDPNKGYAGVFWALLNSAEFMSNH